MRVQVPPWALQLNWVFEEMFFPLGMTAVISIFAGRARSWILGLLALTLLLSLV